MGRAPPVNVQAPQGAAPGFNPSVGIHGARAEAKALMPLASLVCFNPSVGIHGARAPEVTHQPHGQPVCFNPSVGIHGARAAGPQRIEVGGGGTFQSLCRDSWGARPESKQYQRTG